MKKLSVLLIALISGSAMAHSHSPTKFGGKEDPTNAVTLTGVAIVPVVVGTLGNAPQKYDIYVRDEKVNETPIIQPDDFFKMNIPVQLSEPNKPEAVKICSISVPAENTVSYRTRICTEAKLYWVQN